MKVLITNTVALNGGDAAILLSVIDLLVRAFGEETEFVVYDSQPEIASQYYPDLAFRRLLFSTVAGTTSLEFLGKVGRYGIRSLNLLRFYFAVWCRQQGLAFATQICLSNEEKADLYEYSSADLIVSTGGTYLVEGYSLFSRIFDYKVALLLKRPLVFFTQSLGPFLKKNNQKIFSEIFYSSPLILLRDELSLKHLQDINVTSSNIHVSSDVVFSLSEFSVVEQACHQSFPKNPRLKIAISVRNWPHFKTVSSESGMKNFREALCQATQHLVEKLDVEVTYISTCQGIPEYWANDSEVATDIVAQLPEHVRRLVTVDAAFHHPKDLLESLKSYDVVIATRMHMAILALSAGTIVFPIAYEFKTQELFNRLGLGQWVQDIETVRSASLIHAIDSFLQSIPEIQHSLFSNVLEERARALESSSLVKDAFREWCLTKSRL